MKKFTFLFVSLIMFALMVSCSKEATNDGDAMLKKAVVVYGASTPVTAVTPYIIPGANNGGNRTCEEVAAYFSTEAVPVHFDLCGTKIDYSGGVFTGAFPDGLNVTVTEGKFVSFSIDGCISIDGKFYKVGAVIVKGSNAANVYFYPNGTSGDSGLAAPINNSGRPAGLSNLTFCFVECGSMVIALKSYLAYDCGWAVTGGGPSNNYFIGYYDFVPNSSYKIYRMGQLTSPVGNLTISDLDGDHLMEVRIDNSDKPKDLFFIDAYLYVGPADGFDTDYLSYPMQTGPISPASSVTFELPY